MKSVRDQDPNDKMGTTKRIQAILTGIIDEEPLSHIPLNYDIAFICSSIKSHNPEKRNLIYAFQKLGYKCI
jgi:tRNA G26 N,N-dimethylase Trm1